MSRTNFAAMSLIAAVPAALLGFVLVMGFMQHAEGMPVMLAVVAGIALLTSAVVAATPIGILVFGGPRGSRAKKPPKAAAAKAKDDAAAETRSDESIAVEEGASDEFGSSGEVAEEWVDSEEIKAASSDAWDVDESDMVVSEDESDEFEFDDSLSGEFDADIDFDEDAKR